MTVRLNNRDYIWSYIGVFVSVGSNAIMLPFILYFLSGDAYGLWTVFQSVAAITALFDFGFSTTFARNINYCWCGATELRRTGVIFAENKEPNFVLMSQAMTACRYVFLLLSCIALGCMAGPGTAYILHISRGMSVSETMSAWSLYIAAIFLNLYYGYFNSFLRGVGAITDANRVVVAARLVQIGLTVVLLGCGFGLIGTAVAYLIYGFLLRIMSRRAFFRFRGIGKSLAGVKVKTTPGQIREMFLIVWHNASKEGVVTLANYLANQACTLISPLFMSLSMTGIYGMAVQLATVLSNVAAALYNANQPVLQSAYISNDRPLVQRTMSLIVVSYVAIYAFGTLAVVTVGLPLLRLIKPDTTPTVAVMLGAALFQFILKFRNCYTSYFSCTNRILYARAFIVSSALGVMLAVILLYMNWGIWGLLVSQIVSQAVYNGWYWPALCHREIELSAGDMVKLGMQEIIKIVKNFVRPYRGAA